MDPATTNQLIAAGAGVGGAFVGATATLIAGARQHRRQVTAERAKEVRERARQAAKDCDRLLRQLAEDVLEAYRHDPEAPPAVRDRIFAALDDIRMLAVDLPQPLQDRVLERASWLNIADEVGRDGYGGYHYLPVHSIVREIVKDSHQALAAFLRDAEDLPEPSNLVVELAAAFEDHEEMMDIQYEEEIVQAEGRRTRWLESHPKVKGELEKRAKRQRGT
jgi:hypothetical protein